MGKRNRKIIGMAICISFAHQSALATLDTVVPNTNATPIARSRDVTEEEFEAFAEANGLTSLAEYLDARRPGDVADTKLRNLLERSQRLWLTGDLESARAGFREMTKLTLEADWRDSQRETIQYAMLRMAQSAPSAVEREDWLEMAAASFPDLNADPELFPPPLLASLALTKKRVRSLSLEYSPAAHFPGYRFLLINGRKLNLQSDLRIYLPNGNIRITALSDAHPPITEVFSRTQLENFRLTTSPLFSGTCATASGSAELAGISAALKVLFPNGCTRSQARGQWLDSSSEVHSMPANFGLSSGSELNKHYVPQLESGSLISLAKNDEHTEPNTKKRTWLWVAGSAIIAGSAYLYQRQQSQMNNVPTPVHRSGF